MPIYVCNFCGGDHGGSECGTLVCNNCGKPSCGCKLVEQEHPGDFINLIFERLHEEDVVPKGDWSQLKAQFGDDQPIEMLAHIVATYPIPRMDRYLCDLFPPPKDDGKIYNASRRYGNCYGWAYDTLLSDSYPEIESSEETVLVQGFVNATGGGFTGHAWLEQGSWVIDCGAKRRQQKIVPLDQFYDQMNVKHPVRYSGSEARKMMLELDRKNVWVQPPDDLPMCDGWTK